MMVDYAVVQEYFFSDDFHVDLFADATFNDMYPYALDFPFMDDSQGTFDWMYCWYNYPADGELCELMPELAGNAVLGLRIRSLPPGSDLALPDIIETCYYVLNNGSSMLYRCTQADVDAMRDDGLKDPWLTSDPPSVDGNEGILFFLHMLGQYLLENTFLIDLLNFRVGDFAFIDLIFGAGFITYVTWVIIKWAVPV